MTKQNQRVEIILPKDFSQNAYLERRKQYNDNFEKFLNEKYEDNKKENNRKNKIGNGDMNQNLQE